MPGGNGEVDAVHRARVAEGLRDALDDERGGVAFRTGAATSARQDARRRFDDASRLRLRRVRRRCDAARLGGGLRRGSDVAGRRASAVRRARARTGAGSAGSGGRRRLDIGRRSPRHRTHVHDSGASAATGASTATGASRGVRRFRTRAPPRVGGSGGLGGMTRSAGSGGGGPGSAAGFLRGAFFARLLRRGAGAALLRGGHAGGRLRLRRKRRDRRARPRAPPRSPSG